MAINAISYAAADNYRLAKSKRLVAPADETYLLLQIPQFAFVTQVWAWVSTVYSLGSATVTVGWLGNGEVASPAGFMSSDIVDPDALGMKIAMKDSVLSFPGKYFNAASGMLTLTSNRNAGTAGVITVFCEYTVIV
jgi:hypothetical protein